MSKATRDICLCAGTIGLCCVLGFILLAALTGVKVFKLLTFLAALTVVSSALIYIGVSPHVRKRLNRKLQALW